MEKTIKNITKNLLSKLPEGQSRYHPDDLSGAGIPPFVVKRIKVELFRNLAESIVPPQTDWANMESKRVEQSWKVFVEAIHAEALLPASFAPSVMETAVADILEELVKPREFIPEALFSVDDELSQNTLLKRLDTVVVYKYLTKVIPRYMEKKGVDRLSKTQCRRLVAKVDDKVIEKYTPLNWAQLLDPLFVLNEGEVDTELLRLFFKDKGREKLAEKFDHQPDAINRNEMIEMLSTSQMEIEETDDERISEQNTMREDRNKGTEEYVSDADETPLYASFAKETEEDDVEAEKHLNATGGEPEKDEGDEIDEVPIWKKFAEEQESKEYEQGISAEEDQSDPGHEDDSEVIIDLTDSGVDEQQRYERFKKVLSHNQEYYIKEIFGGDDLAYDNALHDLAGFDSWRKASRYLENEIFKRNMVDIFSETAVDLTDNLQQLFTQMQK